jgi:hypothetical protein
MGLRVVIVVAFPGGVTMWMDAAEHVDSYFICATPRTGSSLLLGSLESTGVAGRPQAYFRAPDESLWAERWRIPRTSQGGFDYAEYVRAALATGRTENGVFGAELMWGTLTSAAADRGDDGRGRARVHAEQPGVRERIARQGLHHAARETECRADGDPEEGARQPEVPHDRVVLGALHLACHG